MASRSEQRRLTYIGHVQGVGFRYTTRNLASSFDVVGYVKNLPDGSVELIAEGAPQELDAFLTEVRTALDRHIRNEQSETRPATGQFPAFDIRY